MARPWTDEEIALVLELEAHGDQGRYLSITQIAKTLHRSAEAVSEILHDHGKRIGKAVHLVWTAKPIFDHEPIVTAIEGCRWIEGDPREARYCDAPKKAGSDFCPEHHRRTYTRCEAIKNLDALIQWATR